MFQEQLDNLRERSALVHNITNYVTVNDVANVILAIGGSPIMADDPEDAVEITAICGGPFFLYLLVKYLSISIVFPAFVTLSTYGIIYLSVGSLILFIKC